MRLSKLVPRPAPVPESKAWAALLITWACLSVAAVVYFDSGPTRVLAPSLLAAATSLGLWRPWPWSGLAAAVLALGVFGLALLVSIHAEGRSLLPSAPAVLVLGVGLLGSGILTEALALRTERDDEQRRRDVRLIEELTPTVPKTEILKWEHAASVLREEIARARRYGHTVAFAIIATQPRPNHTEHQAQPIPMDLQLQLATRLNHLVRSTDKLAFHAPGKLALLMPHTPLEGARGALARLQLVAEQSLDLYCSAGLVQFPYDAVDASTLIHEANHALAFADHFDTRVAAHDSLQVSS